MTPQLPPISASRGFAPGESGSPGPRVGVPGPASRGPATRESGPGGAAPEWAGPGGPTGGGPSGGTNAATGSKAPIVAEPTTLRPASLAELRDAVLDVPGRIAISGARTATGWAGRLAPIDALLDTTGLHGVLTHNPGDMTVSVRAGTPLRELQALLAPHGQHVALDAARIEAGATVGGLVATADAGPSALVRGGMRDLVIGTTTVLADGSVVRSGGHVIKNVAGYDLAKLLHGSYGTLGVLAEVVLRLHPVPAAAGTVALDCPLTEAADQTRRVLASQLEPTALEWVSGPDGTSGRLLVRIESTAEALPARLDRLVRLIGTHAQISAEIGTTGTAENRPAKAAPAVGPPGGTAEPADDWSRHAALTAGAPGSAVLRIGARPSRLPALLDRLPWTSATVGLGTGVATVGLPAERDVIADAHAAVDTVGGTSALRARPAWLDAPAWGPPPSALQLLRAVKAEFDPAGRLGPGRFDPWELP